MRKAGKGVALFLSALMLSTSVLNTAVAYGATWQDSGGDPVIQEELSEEVLQAEPDAAEAAEEKAAEEVSEDAAAAVASDGSSEEDSGEDAQVSAPAEEEAAPQEEAEADIPSAEEVTEAEETVPEAAEGEAGTETTEPEQKTLEEERVLVSNPDDFQYTIQSADDTSYAVITGYTGTDTCIEIPESLGGVVVKEIANRAFYRKATLEEVVIPSTVKSIGNSAFAYCNALKKAVLPEGLESIGNYAFYNNDALEEITIPSTVKSIGDFAFESCDALKKAVLPEGLESIGYRTFYYNKSLEEITIPSTVTTIGESAFYGCSLLKTVNLPEGLENIGKNAFECSALEEVTIPSTVKSIGNSAFSSCKSLKKVVLPEGLESIAYGAFQSSALEEVTIPSTVKSIGNSAFAYCRSLKTVTLPEGLESIGEAAFYGSELEKVVIPSKVTTIGASAFCGCSSLKTITLPEGLESIGDDTFRESALEKIVIPSKVTTIGASAFSDCSLLKTITLPEGLESIGWHTFSNCCSLEEIVIPSKVKTIGGSAFYGCRLLKTVTLPEDLESIGASAFCGCSSLTEVTIPSEVTTIGDSAFSGCSSLKTVTLPEGLESIEWRAFYGCSSLTEVTIPSEVTTIGGSAFYGCRLLKTVTLPEGLESIEDYTFYSCVSLTEVTIPSTVKTIGYYAFFWCDSLKTVILPEDLESIGYYAFAGCDSLTFVVFSGSAAEAYAIENNIPYQYYFGEGKKLAVDLVLPEEDISLRGMTLVVEGENFHVQHYLDDTLKEVFSSVQEGRKYQIRLISRFGDVLAEKKDVLISGEETTVQMENILPVRKFSASLLTETGEDVAAECEILWLREDGTTYRKGRYIEDVPDGMKLLCKASLPETYGKVYQEPEAVEWTVSKEAVNCQFTLEKLEKGTLKGVLKSENGPVRGGAVSLLQTLNGKYEVSQTAKTDKNGYFELTAGKCPASLTVSAKTYYPKKMEIVSWEGDEYNLGEISLKKVTGMEVSVEMTYSPRTEEGAKPVKQALEKRNDVSFSIYNKTTEKEVTEFVVQQEELVIYESAQEGDTLTIRAESRSGDFEPVEGSCVIQDKKAAVSLDCVQKGGLKLSYKDSKNETNRFMVYRENGTLEWTSLKQGKGFLQTDALEEGTYTVAVMGGSDLIAYPSTLQGMKDMGLSEGVDYLLQEVKVTRGLLRSVKFDAVPLLDESKYYVNMPEETIFSLGRSVLTVGNYVTLRMKTRLKKEYEGKLKNLKWILEFPESCNLQENTIAQAGGSTVSYVKDKNKYILSVSDVEKMLRMCVIPTAAGEHQIAASLQYEMDGKKITQPVGSVQMMVGVLDFNMCEKTDDTTVRASGKSLPNMKIGLYDNEVLVGQTTSNAAGQWEISFELYQSYTYSTHSIYAQMTDPVTGTSYRTAEKTLVYQYSADPVKVKCVTMIYRNSVIYFDYEGKKKAGGYYSFYPPVPDFTFLVEMSEGSFEKVKDLELQVHCSDGSIRTLFPTADKEKGCWIISSKFNAKCLPENVSVRYDCEETFYLSKEEAEERAESWNETIKIFSDNSLDEPIDLTEFSEISEETEKICKELNDAAIELNKRYEELEKVCKIENDSERMITVKIEGSEMSGKVLSKIPEESELLKEGFMKVPSTDESTAFYIEKADVSLGKKQDTSMILVGDNPQKNLPGVSGSLSQDKIAFKLTIVNEGSPEESRKNIEKALEKMQELQESMEKYEDAIEKTIQEMDRLINVYQESIDSADSEDSWNEEKLTAENGKTDIHLNEKEELIKAIDPSTNPIHANKIKAVIKTRDELIKTKKVLNTPRTGKTVLKSNSRDIMGIYEDMKSANEYADKSYDLRDKAAERAAEGLSYQDYEYYADETEKVAWTHVAVAILGGVAIVAGIVATAPVSVPVSIGLAAVGLIAGILSQLGMSFYENLLDKQIQDLEESDKYFDDLRNGKLPKRKKYGVCPALCPARPIIDPSGYVYEGVLSNKLEGVTATCYEKVTKYDIYGEPYEEVQVWDASVYGQVNPQKTNGEGYYGWDVPQGQWQVVYEKEGYKTARSDWMDVPPPRFDVNIGLVSFAQPKFTVRADKGQITLTFDRYMKTETVTAESVEVYRGKEKLTGSLTAVNEEEAPATGEKLATIFRFVPTAPLKVKDEITVKIQRSAKTYANVNMEKHTTVTTAVAERPTQLLAGESLNMAYSGEGTLEVQALPAAAAAGKKVKVSEYSSFMLSLKETEVVLDKEGKAVFALKALLPGKTSVKFELEDTELLAETIVNIANPPTSTETPEQTPTVEPTQKPAVKPQLKLSKTKLTLYTKGQTTAALKASLTGISGKVSWSSSNEKIAVVSSAGKVTAKKAGTAKITAKCGSLEAVCVVTVKQSQLKLSKTKLTLYTKGQTTAVLKASLTGISGKISWSSSNKKIATVSSKGKVTAKKAGKVKITAKCGSLKAVCTVTVKKPSLKVAKSSLSVKRKKTVKIKATAQPKGKVKFTSSNKKIATVNANGVVKGVRKGKTVITVQCHGIKKKVKITVK